MNTLSSPQARGTVTLPNGIAMSPMRQGAAVSTERFHRAKAGWPLPYDRVQLLRGARPMFGDTVNDKAVEA